MESGCEIILTVKNGNIFADLQTKGKSDCFLVSKEDGIVAYRRYGREDKVEDFAHLLDLVYDCCHGRPFFCQKWVDLLNERGYGDPRGTL